MRILAIVLGLALFAGCAAEQTHGGEESTVGAITPGEWNVSGITDHLLLWAHNGASSQLSGEWSVTIGNASTLPPGWTLSFSASALTLEPNGTKRGGEYPDWAWTLATLTLDANATAGTHNATIHAGSIQAPLRITVAENRGRVSGPGSKVTAQYEGSFQDSGETFDDGSFPTTLGSGQTVPGFDYGLMGLAVGEEASLHLPPALAYGYDNPPGRYAQFNGRWLVFDVSITKLE